MHTMEMYNITIGNVTIDLPVDDEAFSYYELEGKTVRQTVKLCSSLADKDMRLELLIFGWVAAIAEKNITSLSLRPKFCDVRDEHRWDVIIRGNDTNLSLDIRFYTLLLARVNTGIRHEATRT